MRGGKGEDISYNHYRKKYEKLFSEVPLWGISWEFWTKDVFFRILLNLWNSFYHVLFSVVTKIIIKLSRLVNVFKRWLQIWPFFSVRSHRNLTYVQNMKTPIFKTIEKKLFNNLLNCPLINIFTERQQKTAKNRKFPLKIRNFPSKIVRFWSRIGNFRPKDGNFHLKASI